MDDAPVEVGGKNSAGGENCAGVKNSDEPTDPLKSLISVIVPIYNVEKYVRKCLDSLVNQTMKQIEVIAIDDGSTDSSGAIADEYKNPDGWPVIRVIHTENRGLSAARNRGIDEARSEWLMFVDSDDWVDSGFCEIPYRAAIENDCDLVIFQADTVKRGKKCSRPYSGPVGIVDEMTAHEFGGWAAWHKLYRMGLFDGIQYPVGMVFEDYATTHKVVHNARRIAMLEDCLYHYVIRKGSITRTHRDTDKRDSFFSKIQRFDNLLSYGFPKDKLVELKKT